MLNGKNFLIVLSTLFLFGCTSIDKANSFTTINDAQFSPTQTSTLVTTTTPKTVTTSSMAQMNAETPTIFPINQLTFKEDFSSITQKELELKFNVDCKTDYQYLYPVGVYTIKVKQPSPVYDLCVLTPKTTDFERIDEVIARMKFEDGGDDSYIGIISYCGDVRIGFWINEDNLIYTNNNVSYDLGRLPKSKTDYYDLSVTWGETIKVFVNGQQYKYKKNPIIFECSSYPDKLSIGVWLDGNQSVNANIDSISILGE